MDRAVARIIDANFNRAREALRVMEDYVRFVHDDPGACEAAKKLRHDLAGCLCCFPSDELLAARDTPGDVGTVITTASEQSRQDLRAVCVAAAKRLPEALRTIEECTKTIDASVAERIEALRYRAYELEQRVLLRSQRAARFAGVRLYVLITEALCRRPWLETAKLAIAGGAGCLQLREKSIEDGELLERATAFVRLCRDHDCLAIVNDRPDIALLADADGVHLGQTDMPAPAARRIVGPDRLIGVSTHTPAQFDAALACCPDYLAVGPMFASSTKPQDHVPGPELLSYARSRTDTPIVAIGGITADNLPVLKGAGASCACVCSAVIADPDPASAIRRLRGQL